MCQICQIQAIAARDRWPKPLEHYLADVEFLVNSAHDDWVPYQAATASSKETKHEVPGSLLDSLRLLAEVLENLEADREKWWAAPEKRDMRRRLEEDSDQKKLSALHKINNRTTEKIEAMEAKLGQFVRWNLGMLCGIEELRARGKDSSD